MRAIDLSKTKTYTITVGQADFATFPTGTVHEVYSSFALARDAEWCCRLFVLDMLEDDEEGIGSFVHVNHKSPAFLGENVLFSASIDLLDGNKLNCIFEAKVGDRLIATGEQGQRIFKKDWINKHFKQLRERASSK